MGQSENAIGRPRQGGADNDIAITPETVHIRRDIENTRTEMSGTLDAIQQRLDPEVLSEQAKDTASDITAQAREAALEVVDHALAEVKGQATEVLEQAREVLVEARVTAHEVVEDATTQVKAAVRGATIGKVEKMVRNANDTTNAARVGLVETIKANPFPAALAGLGLGWLFINSRNAAARGSLPTHAYEATYREQTARTTSSYGAYQGGAHSPTGSNPVGTAVDRAQATAGNVAGQASDLAGRATGAVGDAAGTVGATVSDAASTLGQAVGNAASTVGETASNLASATQETAGNIAEQAQYRAMRLEDSFQRTLQTNPLAVGAVTLALGAAVGLALPQTQRENQLLGEARDTLVERAQDLAQETLGKVQNVASEAQGTLQESVQSVKETVKEESKKQGLTQ